MKSVLIKKHKGYEIRYKEEKFFVAQKGRRSYISNYDKEVDAEKVIDKLIEEKKKSLEEEKKKRKLKEKNKSLLKTRVVVNGEDFKNMITKTSLLTTEVPLTFKEKKISIKAYDPANVCLLYSSVSFKGNANIVVGVNLNLVLQCLVGKQDKEIVLSLKMVDEKEKKLLISSGLGCYEIPTTEIEERDSDPDLKFHAKAKMSRSVYEQIIKQGSNAGESISFISKNKELYVESKGDLITYKKLIGKVSGKNAKAKYSIEYLKKPYFKNSSDLVLEFNKDYPLKITDEKGDWLLLAPRVG